MTAKKILAICGVVGAVLAAVLFFLGGPAEAQEPEPEAACVGEITGPGEATVTEGTCILLSYMYRGATQTVGDFEGSLPQTLFDQATGTGALAVELPPCLWQVDLVTADAVVVDTLTDYYYGPNGWLVDNVHGGSLCTPDTQVTVPEGSTTTTTTATTVIDTTTTSILGTTLATTAPAPSTTVTAMLARTGDSERRTSIFAAGLAIMGAGFICGSHYYHLRRD